MRKILLTMAFGALALPAVAAGDDSGNSANSPAAQCRQERTTMGVTNFNNTYGTNHNKSNAFGKCVSKQARAQSHNQTNAAAACRTERSADVTAFNNKYGTNRNKTNAFGKCVSQKAQAKTESQQHGELNAARTCRTEQRQDATAFKNKYGTNHNKSNAFGKCVSQTARAQH